MATRAVRKPMSQSTKDKIGAAHRGRKHSQAFCEAMSKARLGRPMPRHIIELAIKANTGRPRSDETKAKISAAQMGRKIPAHVIAKVSAALRGKKKGPYSPEHCAAISAAKKGRPQTEAHREANRVARTGARASAEAKAKLSAARYREWESGRRNVNQSNKYTSLAQALHCHLSSFGVDATPEVRFGRFTVDLYDSANHVAYEADGEYWHNKTESVRPGYHARRDAYLSEKCGLRVVRFTDKEIKVLGQMEAR